MQLLCLSTLILFRLQVSLWTLINKHNLNLMQLLSLSAFILCHFQVAVALEKAAVSDEYFVKRKLYPNVDFYSGLIFITFL